MTTIDRPQPTPPMTALGSIPPLHVAGLADLGVTSGAPELVEIASLRVGDSPRTSGEDPEHTALLIDCQTPLPPILVHRATMEIVDGLHRVQAARAKGQTMIEAVLLDGSRESAFVVAVAVNLGDGLPLSLADRRQAAARIVHSHPHWSDRSISRLVGLSAKTIRTIRGHSDQVPVVDSRTGRDGRVRPIDSAAGRRAAAEYLAAHPKSSLRTVAKHAGISPNTVRDVRNRLSRGEDPVGCANRARRATGRPPATQSRSPAGASHVGAEPSMSVRPLLASLSRDPALRMSDSGRELLRWLHLHAVEDVDVAALMAATPRHRQAQLAEIAARCSVNWSVIAHKMSPHTRARAHQMED
ncbi:hypothetical protein MMAD_35740 [Mycolicibacterium madagascariense]|uniref:ParB-like N-terminal domain-containing protein n=1 Tax=Mycolicibacterium madagascariense TaxID=212765 RepID=A0A7I7XJ99_9MYCO|nr:ParB N-terminal domain-containing protein [Mycolicibacterium madagascariense]MCV7013815.1 ParB N-terminal domain-containing protein [Mycolicibacterium madagascariense]BBZ29279.1 hypothetical protein MMAD_35740 [Mycolicibacterium madagascariense]